MDITHTLKKTTTGVLVSGAVAVAILGLATGTAQADPQSQGPFQWCPGQPLPTVTGYPATHVVWNNGVCHTYWRTIPGRGNVPVSDGRMWTKSSGTDLTPAILPTGVRSLCAPDKLSATKRLIRYVRGGLAVHAFERS